MPEPTPRTIVMSHINRTIFDLAPMLDLAASGCVLSFDLFGIESVYYPQNRDIDMPNDGTRARFIKQLLDRGFASQLLIGQDICMKVRLKHYGGEGYGHLLERTVPYMLSRGVSAQDIRQMCVHNPQRLLSGASPE